jgi:LacI family transcriptional regulator
VIEASRQLGWRRNLLVNGMQTGRTQTVGVMIPPYDSFWVSLLSGIHDTLSAADYLPITVWTGNLERMPHFEEGDSEGKRLINRLLDRRVDGLIMWPAFSLAYYHHFPEFVERRVPVAVIDHYSTVADSVETDEEQAAARAAEHLLSLGHRRIACLSSRETPTQTWAVKRRSSFEATVAKQEGAQFKSWHLNEQGSNAVEMARELLNDELAPTAVFAVTDHEAGAIYRAAAELGRKIPEQLSVVGFADLDFAAAMDPPLTTMRQKPYQIGTLAAKLIMDRISSEAAEPEERTTIKVDAELIIRSSTAAPPISR